MKFKDIPDPFPQRGAYRIDVPWGVIEANLEGFGRNQGVDLDPDYQRAHVWTREKQIAYIEYIMRGGYAAREIFWNCTTWDRHPRYSTPIELVDGKQRLEAVRAFMRGDLPAFGVYQKDFDVLDMMTCRMSWYINDLPTRPHVLKWYLALNSGGVLHTEDELEKVRRMLAEYPA